MWWIRYKLSEHAEPRRPGRAPILILQEKAGHDTDWHQILTVHIHKLGDEELALTFLRSLAQRYCEGSLEAKDLCTARDAELKASGTSPLPTKKKTTKHNKFEM